MKVVIIALVICSSLAQAKLLRLTPLSEQSKYVGCIHYSGRQSPSCGGCYRRRRNSDVCGSLQPESDPCDIYTKDGLGRDICSHCKPGYTLDRTAKIGQRCTKKTTIQSCVAAELVGGYQPTCAACSGDSYVRKYHTQTVVYECSPPAGEPAEQCEWGGEQMKDGARCYRCKEGYTVDVATAQ